LLRDDSPVEVAGVVTQPDRPVGRRQELTPPPVKALAAQHCLPVLQPVSLRRPAAMRALAAFRPDVGVVAAYGKILRPDVLELPAHGHLNVHASLLPRWRGAWPIGAAILAGDVETGVTIMRLDEGMDTGPLLARRAESIRADDTTDALERRLAALGAELLVETLPGFLGGTVRPEPQDDSDATYCHTVGKADGWIDWSRPAVELERHVRAMTPWPGAHTTWDGKQLRVVAARVAASAEPAAPGTVVVAGKRPAVATGEGELVLEAVQLEGRPVTPGAAFLNGYRGLVGSRLGLR
jgi:methionyl-tRNA formyltransferase